jgi:hypothetical protein
MFCSQDGHLEWHIERNKYIILTRLKYENSCKNVLSEVHVSNKTFTLVKNKYNDRKISVNLKNLLQAFQEERYLMELLSLITSRNSTTNENTNTDFSRANITI